MAAVLLIICCAAAAFAAGFFLMKRLDRFLDKNRKSIEKESEAQQPCCVILDKEASDEEILDEIHGFRNSHDDITVIICDCRHHNFAQALQSGAKHKR